MHTPAVSTPKATAQQQQQQRDQQQRDQQQQQQPRKCEISSHVLIRQQPAKKTSTSRPLVNPTYRHTRNITTKFTDDQLWTLFCLSLINFCSYLSMSIIAPFFPLEASNKGVSTSTSGFIFSIYALVVMIAAPLLAKVIPIVGAKFMLLNGILISGVCNILFGLLDAVDGQYLFTCYCFLVRAFEAFGAAAFTTASYTFIMQRFPDDIGVAFGIAETCVGVGMCMGPAVGSLLYTIGGYGLPFYSLGTLILLCLPISAYLIKPINSSNCRVEQLSGPPSSYLKLLMIPEIMVVCLVVIVVSQAQSFLDPTLEPHLRQFGLSSQLVGLVFLLMSGAYAITSPLVGTYGHYFNKFSLMALGLLACGLALLVMGPAPFLPWAPNMIVSICATFIMGVAYSISFIPTFESIIDCAIAHGFSDDISTHSIVSGLWSCVYSLGEVLGPSLGGIMVERYNFEVASTVMAIATLVACVITIKVACSCGRRYGSQHQHQRQQSQLPQ